MNFNDLQISEEIKRAVSELEFSEATEIQEKSIPIILDGADVIGFSQTGSGKTAAFGIPAIEFVDKTLNPKKPQVLIMCPTRELAMQGADELRKFSKYVEGIHIVPVYGGQPIDRQFSQLKNGCQIVIGTPGRIMDHMRRKTLKLENIKMVVLDEADEMLDMGFREDIETILSETPEERQTVLFSATMPKPIIEITGKYQKDPQMVRIESKQLTAVNIEQSYFEVARGRKMDALSLLLQYYKPSLSLVFCNTKKMVDEVVADLKDRGYSADGLHGDLKQQQRTFVMNRFKNRAFEILVATDVAARGIDVNDIDIVFNYDLPDDSEYYVHRIGRTARAGKDGKSFTLIQGPRQYRDLMEIARLTKSTITKKDMPKVKDIEKENTGNIVEEIKSFHASHDCSSCKSAVDALREAGLTDEDIASSLLQMLLDEKCLKKRTVDVPVEASYSESKAYGERGGRRDGKHDGKHRERTPNARAQKKFEGVDMAKISISIGRLDKIAPKHILGAVAGESGLPGSIMGTIDIGRDRSTIDVPKEYKARIIHALNGKSIKGKKVTVK